MKKYALWLPLMTVALISLQAHADGNKDSIDRADPLTAKAKLAHGVAAAAEIGVGATLTWKGAMAPINALEHDEDISSFHSAAARARSDAKLAQTQKDLEAARAGVSSEPSALAASYAAGAKRYDAIALELEQNAPRFTTLKMLGAIPALFLAADGGCRAYELIKGEDPGPSPALSIFSDRFMPKDLREPSSTSEDTSSYLHDYDGDSGFTSNPAQ